MTYFTRSTIACFRQLPDSTLSTFFANNSQSLVSTSLRWSDMASNEKPADSPSLPRGLLSRGGTPTSKNTRLPSIRTPRDLTLGGVKKKTFVPNIPQRKEKPKPDNTPVGSKNASDNKGTPRPKVANQRKDDVGRGRGRGRNKPEVIQSHSIFEQGPTEKSLKERGSSYGKCSSSGASSSDGISLKAKIKREKPEETQRILDGLLRDDFIDGADLDNDLNPIKLPLASSAELKPDILDTEINSSRPDKVLPHVKARVKDIECADLFSNSFKTDRPPLLFFQLPDVLPGLCLSDDDKRNGRDQGSDNQEKTEAKDKAKNNLGDFSEGHIGKIQVLKSGKCRLLLGQVSLDVFTGTPCGFLQDVVSVKVDGSIGDMKVLGHLDYRLVCSPDFESLLQSDS